MDLAAGKPSPTVDYLTLTALKSRGIKRPRQKKLVALADDLIAREKSVGNDLKTWTMGDFTGYSCGSIQAAAYADGVLVRVSSHLAATYWRDLIPYASNISRLDLAVTVTMPDPATNLVRKHHQAVMRWRRQHMPRLQVCVIDRGDLGATLALGSRQSDVYLRCYDKHRESKGQYPPGTWRYEVEYKREQAKHMALQLASFEVAEPSIASSVFERFRVRGVIPPWSAVDTALPLKPYERLSDESRRLRWLAAGVRPSVETLIAGGRLSELLDALGLSPYVQPV